MVSKTSISTIYYWINKGKLGNCKLLYPRKKRKKARNTASPKFKHFGKTIDERPEYINNRVEKGHFEIDTLLLKKEKGQCLLTMTDRFSRYEIIRLIDNKDVISVNTALKDILKEYDIKSITADNGSEFAGLYQVFDKGEIYYAHPYSSWERGSNENQNRMIRRWIPKKTKKTTSKEVTFIENWINCYPKKILNYKSPKEIYLSG